MRRLCRFILRDQINRPVVLLRRCRTTLGARSYLHFSWPDAVCSATWGAVCASMWLQLVSAARRPYRFNLGH